MDIDKILHTKVEVNNDREKLTAYNLSRGPSYSLNENLVPEQLFNNPDTPEKEADGISATKALGLAAQQGQTIYTVTKANYAEVLPKLNHSDVVMTDIRNGVNAGKTVTVHDTQITLNGWSGTGYTILDPESGAGAYMIGGGLDGGFLQFMSDNGNYYALAIGILGIVATTAGIGGILLFAVLAISFLVGFLVALGQNLDLLAKGCPKELLIANLLFTIAAFLVGSLAKVFLDALVRTIGGWIYTSIVPSVGNLFKYK